jgi:hypothetical protein
MALLLDSSASMENKLGVVMKPRFGFAKQLGTSSTVLTRAGWIGSDAAATWISPLVSLNSTLFSYIHAE